MSFENRTTLLCRWSCCFSPCYYDVETTAQFNPTNNKIIISRKYAHYEYCFYHGFVAPFTPLPDEIISPHTALFSQ